VAVPHLIALLNKGNYNCQDNYVHLGVYKNVQSVTPKRQVSNLEGVSDDMRYP